MTIEILPEWLSGLDEEDINFIKRFLLVSGSLKEMSKLYNVTYPTLRLKLDRLIQKIQINDKSDSDSYVTLIKKLALDEKMDFYTAKLLVTEYKKQKE